MRFWRIWLMALLYAIGETWHFGWNAKPHTDAEVICDGIACIILAIAFISEDAPKGGAS